MDATDIVYITAEAIAGFVTIVGNSLVLAAIIKARKLHTITNAFVGSLAIADIAVGVLVAPCAALSFMGLPRDFYGCVFINCLILMFTNVSILMLLSVAFERFLAIKEPFLYHRLLTVRRSVYVNICVWILAVILGLMPMYGWHGGYREVDYCRFTEVITYEYMVYFQFFTLVVLPLFIMLCIYIYILIIVRRHLRQTNALHNRFHQNNGANDGNFNKDVRAAKMFALVILMFAVMWFPVNIFNCVSLFCGSSCQFPKEVLLIAIVMSHANSSINPLLYATSNSRIRGAIKEIFGIKPNSDERSSSDLHNARQTENGTPRFRSNMAPASSADESSNYKDDVRPFSISNDEFHPVTSCLSIQQNELNHEMAETITLNTINHSISNTSTDYNINSHNHKPHIFISSSLPLAVTEIPPHTHSPAPEPPDQVETQHRNTNNSRTSGRHSNHNHKPNHLPNLAFVNSEPTSESDGINDHESTSGISCSSGANSGGDITESGNILKVDNSGRIIIIDNLQNLPNKHLTLWCWETSGSKEIPGDAAENVKTPATNYQHASHRTLQSPSFIPFHKRTNSADSIEDFTVKNFSECMSSQTSLSDLSYQGTTSYEELELADFGEEDAMGSSKKSCESEDTTEMGNITSFRSSILVDDCGTVRNSKTEHTKL